MNTETRSQVGDTVLRLAIGLVERELDVGWVFGLVFSRRSRSASICMTYARSGIAKVSTNNLKASACRGGGADSKGKEGKRE